MSEPDSTLQPGSESWRPGATVETLRRRAELIVQVRQFFEKREFVEVQTPVLARDTVVDRFIEPIAVSPSDAGQADQPFWLQTSPEFFMKRLVAAGATKIFQIGPVFRAAEQGSHHNIEFTMLEWYRVGDSYQQGIDLLDDFAKSILDLGPALRLTYREAFQSYADLDPFDEEKVAHAVGELRATGDHLDHDENLNWLLLELVEPKLKQIESVIICDWPASQAALSKTRMEGGVSVAERFELYVRGMELANGYHELTDAKTLRDRNRENNKKREADGRRQLPENSRLMDAMADHFPSCCGVALGIDRLVMLALEVSNISEVMAFDFERV